LRRINAQHINVDKLEAAMVDVINQYVHFPLPRHWGGGRTAVADRTHVTQAETTACKPPSGGVQLGQRAALYCRVSYEIAALREAHLHGGLVRSAGR
jgi:hypothetical protein